MAGKKLRIIIEGETGHGKSLLAMLMHREFDAMNLPAFVHDCGSDGPGHEQEVLARLTPHTRLIDLHRWPDFYERIDIETRSSVPDNEDSYKALCAISKAMGNPCLEAKEDETLADALARYVIERYIFDNSSKAERMIRLAVTDPDVTLDRILVKDVEHRDVISGWNAIAVLAGTLCVEGSCEWCDELRTRCQSRRLA